MIGPVRTTSGITHLRPSQPENVLRLAGHHRVRVAQRPLADRRRQRVDLPAKPPVLLAQVLGVVDQTHQLLQAFGFAHGFGVGSPTGVMVPATASPPMTVTSMNVTSSRTPVPRSASAVAVICTLPTPAPGTMNAFVVSASAVTAAMFGSDDAQETSPSTTAGLPLAST